MSGSIELLVKMKNVSFTLWKKINGLFGQPNRLAKKSISGNAAELLYPAGLPVCRHSTVTITAAARPPGEVVSLPLSTRRVPAVRQCEDFSN